MQSLISVKVINWKGILKGNLVKNLPTQQLETKEKNQRTYENILAA